MVGGVEGAHRLGHVGLGDDDGAEGLEEHDEGRVCCGGLEGEGGEAEAGVDAGDVEGVFEGDGEAVQGPDGRAGAAEVRVEVLCARAGSVEERFGEAAGELMGDGCSLIIYCLAGCFFYIM